MRGEQKWFATWEDAMAWIRERMEVGMVFHSWAIGSGIVVRMIDRRTGE